MNYGSLAWRGLVPRRAVASLGVIAASRLQAGAPGGVAAPTGVETRRRHVSTGSPIWNAMCGVSGKKPPVWLASVRFRSHWLALARPACGTRLARGSFYVAGCVVRVRLLAPAATACWFGLACADLVKNRSGNGRKRGVNPLWSGLDRFRPVCVGKNIYWGYGQKATHNRQGLRRRMKRHPMGKSRVARVSQEQRLNTCEETTVIYASN